MILSYTFAQKITEIPTTGTPPSVSISIESIYDPLENQIISFGGRSPKSTSFSPSLSMFSLSNSKWKSRVSQSLVTPSGLSSSKLYLRSDRKLLVFFGSKDSGLSSDIYSYNLITDSWALETLQDNLIPACTKAAFTSFTYANNQYLALFGGMTTDGASNSLYLINPNAMTASKLPASGKVPQPKLSASIVFYNNCLYLYGESWATETPNSYDKEVFVYSLINQTWSILDVKGNRPQSRSEHFAYVYEDCMYILYGKAVGIEFDEIWRFNISKNEWKVIESGGFRTDFGAVGVENMIYLVMGKNLLQAINSIDVYTIDQGNIKRSILSANWNSPTIRKNHCSFTISDKLLIFGGESYEGKYLNDMWEYDITQNSWSTVINSGDVPSPRASFAWVEFFGAALAIYGGRDDTDIFGDFYYYEANAKQWQHFLSTTARPAARYNSCLCTSGFYVFIIGGQNHVQAFDDVWVFNYFQNTCELIGKISVQITNFQCWSIESAEKIEIFIVGGSNFNGIPNTKVYKITLISKQAGSSDFSMGHEVIFESPHLAITDSAVIVKDSLVFLVFGSISDTYVRSSIVNFNYITFELKISQLSTTVGRFGHSAAHYRDAFYVFGGVGSLNQFKGYSEAEGGLLMIQMSEDSLFNIPCSLGTVGKECKPCPAGTYAAGLDCVGCPPGTYSGIIAAESFAQCIPCGYGSFSKDSGAVRCLQCPQSAFCPINSVQIMEFFKIPNSQSNQPHSYKKNYQAIINYTNYAWYCIFGLSALLLTFTISSNSLYRSLQKFDIFVQGHRQNLNVPVVFKKTSIGGVFSILFIVSATLTITISSLSYHFDNVSEIRSLVPVTTLNQHIKATEFSGEIIYYSFGGNCTKGNSLCNNDVIFTSTGFTSDSESIACYSVNDLCIIQFTYFGFTLQNDSKIHISLTNGANYAAGISVNLSVSSGIPNQYSNIYIPIIPDSLEVLFRGTVPTIIYYEAYPTIFSSESSEWSGLDTGYHITDKGIISKGSTVSPKELYSKMFVVLELQISIGSTGFTVNRVLSSSLFLMAGTTLGSVFGLLGVFVTVMGIVEQGYDRFIDSRSRKVFRKRVMKVRGEITHCLGIEYDRKCLYKVRPTEMTSD